MHDASRGTVGFLNSQQSVRNKCLHPIGTFAQFKKEEIELSISKRYEQQVCKHPDRLAIEIRGQQLSYTALNEAANRAAWAIIAARKPRDKPVAILFEQGPQSIAAMLGVLKAGHFYVPLDPTFPLPRLTCMLEDSQAVLLMTNNHHLSLANDLVQSGSHVLNIDHLPADLSTENPCCSTDPDSLACLIYTSGSTGQPKGVIHSQRTLLHMTMIETNAFRICAEDRCALFHSPSFIGTTRLIFLALLNGAALYYFNIKAEGLTHFGTWLTQKGITFYRSAPTVFRHLISTLRGDEAFSSIRLMWLSGEAADQMDVALYKKHFSPDCLFIHGFGSTETGPVLFYFVDQEMPLPDHKVPLGYLVDDAEVMLFNENGEEVGNNCMGEIAVKSRYLALGYWRQPELTQSIFRHDPSGGDTRIYHTGDLGRWLSDGCLEHLGRKDWQVKIRGHRIEVSEVEGALLEMPAVTEAVVTSWEFQKRDTRLVAYFVPEKNSTISVSEVRRYLQAKLPEYMVPSAFVRLDALPQISNGKVDRQALPIPNQSRPELETTFVAPRTAVEKVLSEIWSEVLGVERLGIHDNFFELGGHSLLATQVMSRLSGAFRLELSLRSMLEAPTVAALAEQIATVRWALQGPRTPCGDAIGDYEEGEL